MASKRGRRPAQQPYKPPGARRQAVAALTKAKSAQPFEDFQRLLSESVENDRWNLYADLVDLSLQCGEQFDAVGDDTDRRWRVFVDTVLDAVLQQGTVQLAVEISAALISRVNFARHVCEALLQSAALYLDTESLKETEASADVNEPSSSKASMLTLDKQSRNLIEFCASLMIHQWLPPYNVCDASSNVIMVTVEQLINTWLIDMQEQCEWETNGADVDERDEEDRRTTVVHALCVCILCNKAGRRFWLAHPELSDSIWAAMRNLIVSIDPLIRRSTKLYMLSTWQKINEWTTKSNAVRRANAITLSKAVQCNLDVR